MRRMPSRPCTVHKSNSSEFRREGRGAVGGGGGGGGGLGEKEQEEEELEKDKGKDVVEDGREVCVRVCVCVLIFSPNA